MPAGAETVLPRGVPATARAQAHSQVREPPGAVPSPGQALDICLEHAQTPMSGLLLSGKGELHMRGVGDGRNWVPGAEAEFTRFTLPWCTRREGEQGSWATHCDKRR